MYYTHFFTPLYSLRSLFAWLVAFTAKRLPSAFSCSQHRSMM